MNASSSGSEHESPFSTHCVRTLFRLLELHDSRIIKTVFIQFQDQTIRIRKSFPSSFNEIFTNCLVLRAAHKSQPNDTQTIVRHDRLRISEDVKTIHVDDFRSCNAGLILDDTKCK